MSIGFLGAGISDKITDLYTGNGASAIDVSLQNVLSKYDTIRTDFDRLADSAKQGTFDLTSRAQYNNYEKESVNGWAETWYAEYRAVLTLRADALQKKLQAAYNRVLEKSAYADMAPDVNSVFAPYANRTYSGADVTNTMPVSKVLYSDQATPGGNDGGFDTTIAPPVDNYVRFYTDSTWKSKVRDYILNGRTGVIDGNGVALDNLHAEPPGALTKTLGGDWVVGQDDRDARDAQIRWTEESVQDALTVYPMTVGSYTSLQNDAAIGATSITVATGGVAAAGIIVGKNVDIDGQARIVTSISGDTVSFADPLTRKVSAGAVIKGTFLTQADYDRTFDAMVEAALKTTSNNLEALRDTQPNQHTNTDGSPKDPTEWDMRDDPTIAHWVRGPSAGNASPNKPYGIDNSGSYYPSGSANLANDLEGGYRLNPAREKEDRLATASDFLPVGTQIHKYDIKVDKYGNPIYLWNDGSYYDSALGAALSLNPNAPKQSGGTGGIPGASSQMADVYSTLDSLGNPRLQLPMFGTGEFGTIDLASYIPANIKDTLAPGAMEAIIGAANNQMDYIKNIMVGRQYDDIVGGNQYADTNFQTSLGIYPGVTVKAIERVDAENKAGSIIQSGSRGLIPKIDFNFGVPIGPLGPTTIYIHLNFDFSIAVGPDVYYGHDSTLSNLSSEQSGNFADAALKALTSNPLQLPQIGFGGFMFGMQMGVGAGSDEVAKQLQFPLFTMSMSFSYDILNKMMTDILKALKKKMVEAMQVQSYAASSGTAMDSYASRAEYHMTEPGFSEAMKAMALTFDFGLFKLTLDFGGMFNDLLFNGIPAIGVTEGILTAGGQATDTINGAAAKDRLFSYDNSVQGAETRETETGAFFATNAFLSQFEMEDMNSNYWIGTQQNEEQVNMDFGRAMTGAGKQIVQTIIKGLNMISNGPDRDPVSKASSFATALADAFTGFNNEARMTAMMYDLLFRDQNASGGTPMVSTNLLQSDTPFLDPLQDLTDPTAISDNKMLFCLAGLMVPRIPIIKSTFKSEAYDYVESDHKPFEGDSDFNYVPKSGPLSVLNGLFNAGTPDFIMDGYANTRRFVTTANDGNLTAANLVYDPTAAGGVGPRGHAGAGGTNGNPDGTFWNDTPLGDINEVYVGTRNVSFKNLEYGFGEFTNASLLADKITDTGAAGAGKAEGTLGATRVTEAGLERFVGVDSRIYGRRYDPADPVNHETFNAGLYSSQYGGQKQHYDRVNQYSMDFTAKADGNKLSLFGASALNPTFGGTIKLAEIDKNAADTSLLEYEDINPATGQRWKSTDAGYVAGPHIVNSVKNISATRDKTNDQKFGAATDGTLNDLNQTLYECLHLRADGKNLSTIKDYRDVFDSGLLKNIFLTGSAYHPTGGGITSSIEIRYDRNAGTSTIQSDSREASTAVDPYNQLFQNKTRGKATIFLNTYSAYKKRASNKKT